MKRLIGLWALLVGLGLASAAASAPSSSAPACAPEGKVAYVCGLMNVEDMDLDAERIWIRAKGARRLAEALPIAPHPRPGSPVVPRARPARRWAGRESWPA